MRRKKVRGHMDNQPTPETKSKKQYQVTILKHGMQFSLMEAVTFAAVFAVIGGLLLIKSFAASPQKVSYQPPHAVTLPAELQIKRQTMQLVGLAKRLQKKPGDASLTQQAATLAADRASAMKALMADKPQTAVLAHFPDNLLSALPAAAQANIEKTVELQGTLHLSHGEALDPKTGQFFNPLYDYTLSGTASGDYNLHFSGEGPEAMSGNSVKVSGVQLGTEVAVNSDNDVSLAGSVHAATTATVKKVAVLLFTFADNATQPITPAQASTDVFGTAAPSVNDYYTQQSFNQVSLGGIANPAGDVFGYYSLKDTSSSCANTTWASDAKAAATAAGANLSGYNNFVYIFPLVSACSWAGWSNMPGSNSWINYDSTWSQKTAVGTISHELGHAFGVNHASSYICTDASGAKVAYSNTCTSGEYGDPFDVMGIINSLYEMNAFHKGQLNYLQAGNTQNVTTSGTYTIAPEESAGSGTESLRIPVVYNSSNQPTTFLYMDYRQPIGSYDTFSGTSTIATGISLRFGPDYGVITQSHLLDNTPGSILSYFDSPLVTGHTFTDTIHNLSVTTVSTAAAGATVQINMGGGSAPACTHSNPTLGVSPASQWGNPGDSLTYNVSVTNNDGGSCAASSFNLSSALPSGLSQSPATSAVSLAPGASATVAVTVASANTLTSGFYNFTESVSNGSAAGYTASATGAYNVNSTADTTAPAAAISAPATGATVSGTVNVTASADDNVGVTTTELYVDGALRTYSTSGSLSFSWDTAQETDGQHTLVAKAYDAAGNVGTSSTVTVTVRNQSDTVAPAVTITSPSDGLVITRLKKVSIAANGADNIAVSKMEVYTDGALRASSATGSISYTWSINRSVKAGTHTITVKAYDAAGNVGQSSITVTK
jgi:hypothetical protein